MTPQAMRLSGYLLFSAGIVPAFALALPEETPWGWFLFFTVLSAAGALILRRYGMTARHAPRGCREPLKERGGNTLDLLDAIGSAGRGVIHAGEPGHVEDAGVKDAIERMQVAVISIVEMKREIEDLLGGPGAHRFLSVFAGAERTLARAWSALVDGYRDEALRCLGLSLEIFGAAGDIYREHCSRGE